MSILIKEMKMPENCNVCPFNYDLMECMAASHKIRLNWETRPKECPLVEVPTPHGRLIDAKKLECELMKEKTRMGCLAHITKDPKDMGQVFGLHKAKLLSLFQPTIIEAEGDVENERP